MRLRPTKSVASRSIFNMHETSGVCAGVYACNHMNQMKKTVAQIMDMDTQKVLQSL